MNNEERGCPRCSDYDQLKEELENNKKNADREAKDSLKECQSEKKRLNSKLLKLGAVAIVAGTILGKEFVDKVTSYFDTFNDVKETTTKMLSKAETSTPSPVDEKPEPNKETKPKVNIPRTPAFPYVALSSPKPYGFSQLAEPYDPYYDPAIFERESYIDLAWEIRPEPFVDTMQLNLAGIIPRTNLFELPMDNYAYDTEFYAGSPRAVVPGPSVLVAVVLGIILLKKGRSRY